MLLLFHQPGLTKGHVYLPRDDTWLLLDTLLSSTSKENFLLPSACRRRVHRRVCGEVGVGSGIVLTTLAKRILGCKDWSFWGSDLNDAAVNATKQTLESDIIPKCVPKADLLIFNPPYVPSSEEEIAHVENYAWAGGPNGTKIIDQFFEKSEGCLNKFGQIAQRVAKKYGYSPYRLSRRTTSDGFESLQVWRFHKNNDEVLHEEDNIINNNATNYFSGEKNRVEGIKKELSSSSYSPSSTTTTETTLSASSPSLITSLRGGISWGATAYDDTDELGSRENNVRRRRKRRGKKKAEKGREIDDDEDEDNDDDDDAKK
eukprot:jgi/Bigna1/140885/aug1.59_g15593